MKRALHFASAGGARLMMRAAPLGIALGLLSAHGRAEDAAPRARRLPLEFGPDAGASFRAVTGEGIRLLPGFRYGGHLAVELNSWLFFRGAGSVERHAVRVDRGALGQSPGLADTDFSQPALRFGTLTGQLEPNWHFGERLRGFLALGAAFNHLDLPGAAARARDCTPAEPGVSCALRAPHRAGTLVDAVFGVGAAYELWTRRLLLTAQGSGAVPVVQTGRLYKEQQAFVGGRRERLGPFPELGLGTHFALGLGFVL
jgi:hypothetical protein